MSDVTYLLEAIGEGDPKAAEGLLRLVYEELRRLAGHQMAGERPGHTLHPTALEHEAWLRLAGDKAPQFQYSPGGGGPRIGRLPEHGGAGLGIRPRLAFSRSPEANTDGRDHPPPHRGAP